jgi:hypothetical protein
MVLSIQKGIFMNSVAVTEKVENVDATFDLVIGDLEKEIPTLPVAPINDSGSGTSCGTCVLHSYCC